MFDQVVLLTLPRSEDRLSKMYQQLHQASWPWWPKLVHGVDASLVPAPRMWPGPKGSWGCMQSHRRIMEDAIMARCRSLLILEDDCIFVDGFAEKLKMFLGALPHDWQGIMFGGEHIRPPLPINNAVVRCMNTQRTHCYAMREPYLSKLYQQLISTRGHCDHRMCEIQDQFKVYAPRDFLVGQASGPSLIMERHEQTRYWVEPLNQVVVHVPYHSALAGKMQEAGFELINPRVIEQMDVDEETKRYNLTMMIKSAGRRAKRGVAFVGSPGSPLLQEVCGDLLVYLPYFSIEEVLQHLEEVENAIDLPA